MVVVRNFDGTYQMMTVTSGDSIVAANRPPPQILYRMTGGDVWDPQNQQLDIVGGTNTAVEINSVLPAVVRFVFPYFVASSSSASSTLPEFACGVPGTHVDQRCGFKYTDSYGAVYTLDVALADLGLPYSNYVGIAGTQKVFVDTAKAYVASPGDTYPLNLSDLTALAQTLAACYYDFLLRALLSEGYAGIEIGNPTPATISSSAMSPTRVLFPFRFNDNPGITT